MLKKAKEELSSAKCSHHLPTASAFVESDVPTTYQAHLLFKSLYIDFGPELVAVRKGFARENSLDKNHIYGT